MSETLCVASTVVVLLASTVDSGQLTFSSGQIRTLVLLDNFGSGFTSAMLADLN